jgi:signal transduction histidine kinase
LLPRLNHRIVFASALFLLLVSGAAFGWMFYQTYASEQWVRHTYNVELLVSQVIFDLNKTGRDRQIYVTTGDPQVLAGIRVAHNEIFRGLGELKQLVRDNADQEGDAVALEQAIGGRFATLDDSLNLYQAGKSTQQMQDGYTRDLVSWSAQISGIAKHMQDTETRLLTRRTLTTQSLFSWTIFIAALSYVLSLYVLWEHYRGLTRELRFREIAEQRALRLSAQLLGAQDQERRKIARDLHDGLGQVLVAAKMTADSLLHRPEDKRKLLELSELLAEAVSSTRSISHLLHPPLVDELGFVAAARSYLDGFAKRAGIEVESNLPAESEERLPRDLELVLFRILQEALTNIQRHSKSLKAEVQFQFDRRTAILKIRDFGVGLPAGLLEGNGSTLGVGLAGMKERVREHNGRFEIHSDSRGTLISATLPVGSERLATEQRAATPTNSLSEIPLDQSAAE